MTDNYNFMKIKDMPWFNRPGARLKKKGPSSLSDAELLAIVLGRGDKNENAVDQANRVLATQNLDKLSSLSLPELENEFHNPVKAMKINGGDHYESAEKNQRKFLGEGMDGSGGSHLMNLMEVKYYENKRDTMV